MFPSSSQSMKVDATSSNQKIKVNAICSNRNVKVDDKHNMYSRSSSDKYKYPHVEVTAMDSEKDQEHDSSSEDCSCKSCLDSYAKAFSQNRRTSGAHLFHKEGSHRVIQELGQDSKPIDTALERTTKQVCKSDNEKKPT
ncbi:MAG: hypothetical protein Q9209_002202 [Squamulea sp. 1 TL-2023]